MTNEARYRGVHDSLESVSAAKAFLDQAGEKGRTAVRIVESIQDKGDQRDKIRTPPSSARRRVERTERLLARSSSAAGVARRLANELRSIRDDLAPTVASFRRRGDLMDAFDLELHGAWAGIPIAFPGLAGVDDLIARLNWFLDAVGRTQVKKRKPYQSPLGSGATVDRDTDLLRAVEAELTPKMMAAAEVLVTGKAKKGAAAPALCREWERDLGRARRWYRALIEDGTDAAAGQVTMG